MISFKLKNGSVIFPQFKFYLKLCLQCTRGNQLAYLFSRKRFSSCNGCKAWTNISSMKTLTKQSMNSNSNNLVQNYKATIVWDWAANSITWSILVFMENPKIFNSAYHSMQNWKGWGSTIVSLTISFAWISLNHWKWTQTEALGKNWGTMTAAMTLLRQMQKLISASKVFQHL